MPLFIPPQDAPSFATRAVAATVGLPTGSYLRLLSTLAAFKGTQAIYKVQAGAPNHGGFQLAGGNYAALQEILPDLTMFQGNGDDSTNNDTPISDALGYVSDNNLGGLLIPPGIFRYGTGLTWSAYDGISLFGWGHANHGTAPIGQRSTLKYTGSGTAIDAQGADDTARVGCGFRDIALVGVGNGAAKGFKFGHNHRCLTLLDNCLVYNFGGHGVWLAANNWIVNFNNLNIYLCGFNPGSNGSGIFKEPGALDIHDVSFSGHTVIENCGATNNTSSAGAINWQTTDGSGITAGLKFDTLTMEACYGVNVAFISQVERLGIDDLYMEDSQSVASRDGMFLWKVKGLGISRRRCTANFANAGDAIHLNASDGFLGPSAPPSTNYTYDISYEGTSKFAYVDSPGTMRVHSDDATGTATKVG